MNSASKFLMATASLMAAGVITYGVLTAPNRNGGDNAFSDLRNQNITYTAGTQGGDDSERFITAQNLGILDRQEMKAQQALRAQELASEQQAYDQYNANNMRNAEAYQISNENFGLANGVMGDPNGSSALESSTPDLSGLSSLMQNAVNAANAGAQSAANGQGGASGQAGKDGKPGQGEFTRATMAKAGEFGLQGNSSIKAGGNTQTSTWDAGNKNAAKEGLDALQNANAMLNNLTEGTKLSSRGAAVSNKANFASGTGREVRGGRAGDALSGHGANDLVKARKDAAKIAQLPQKSANAMAQPFLGSNELGGISLGENGFNNNLGNSSTSDQKFFAGLKHAGQKLASVGDKARQRAEDGNKLKRTLWTVFIVVLVLAVAIPFVKKIPLYGYMAALAMLAIGAGAIIKLVTSLVSFAKQWGMEGIAITTLIMTVLMTAGLLCSFFLSSGAKVMTEGAQGASMGAELAASLGGGLASQGVNAGIDAIANHGSKDGNSLERAGDDDKA